MLSFRVMSDWWLIWVCWIDTWHILIRGIASRSAVFEAHLTKVSFWQPERYLRQTEQKHRIDTSASLRKLSLLICLLVCLFVFVLHHLSLTPVIAQCLRKSKFRLLQIQRVCHVPQINGWQGDASRRILKPDDSRTINRAIFPVVCSPTVCGNGNTCPLWKKRESRFDVLDMCTWSVPTTVNSN